MNTTSVTTATKTIKSAVTKIQLRAASRATLPHVLSELDKHIRSGETRHYFLCSNAVYQARLHGFDSWTVKIQLSDLLNFCGIDRNGLGFDCIPIIRSYDYRTEDYPAWLRDLGKTPNERRREFLKILISCDQDMQAQPRPQPSFTPYHLMLE